MTAEEVATALSRRPRQRQREPMPTAPHPRPAVISGPHAGDPGPQQGRFRRADNARVAGTSGWAWLGPLRPGSRAMATASAIFFFSHCRGT